MNMKSRVGFFVKLLGLFVVGPYLLAQVTAAGMGFISPPPSKQLPEEITGGPKPETNRLSMKAIQELQDRADIHIGRLEHTRFLTRSALIAVGLYYVAAIPAFIFIRRKRKNTKTAEVKDSE